MNEYFPLIELFIVLQYILYLIILVFKTDDTCRSLVLPRDFILFALPFFTIFTFVVVVIVTGIVFPFSIVLRSLRLNLGRGNGDSLGLRSLLGGSGLNSLRGTSSCSLSCGGSLSLFLKEVIGSFLLLVLFLGFLGGNCLRYGVCLFVVVGGSLSVSVHHALHHGGLLHGVVVLLGVLDGLPAGCLGHNVDLVLDKLVEASVRVVLEVNVNLNFTGLAHALLHLFGEYLIGRGELVQGEDLCLSGVSEDQVPVALLKEGVVV